MNDDIQAQLEAEYERAEQYLQSKRFPEERWPIDDPRPWWKVSQLEGKFFGMDGASIRLEIIRGVETEGREGIPGGVLESQQAGWKVPRWGAVIGVYRRWQAIDQRRIASGR